MKIGVGLYCNNGGHQIHKLLDNNLRAKVVAICGLDEKFLSEIQKNDPELKRYSSLEEMASDPRIEIISLCSNNRKNQPDEAIMCMRKGKHVYAEKPCSMTEEDLDRIIAVSKETGCLFREMAGTGFQQPTVGIRKIVDSGILGEIVQVFAQKSYPYHERRPQNEDIDGGLIEQNGIHAVRFIEHGVGIKVDKVYAIETKLGNPHSDGDLRMAASLMMTLQNGGVASMVVNYLNQEGIGHWGNEHLRVFGTKGMVEFTDGGKKTRLIIGMKDCGEIDTSDAVKDYFEYFLDTVKCRGNMPISLEDELHCTRIVIRAKQSAKYFDCISK